MPPQASAQSAGGASGEQFGSLGAGGSGGSMGENVVQASHIGVPTVGGQRTFRDITLNEAIQLALQNSSVIRDLGGRVVSQPGQTNSNLNPVLIGSDPRIGIDAALSAFDAQLQGSFAGRRNNRGLQQFVPLSPNTQIVQNQSDLTLGARRTLTTGTNVGLTNFTNYRRDDLGRRPIALVVRTRWPWAEISVIRWLWVVVVILT